MKKKTFGILLSVSMAAAVLAGCSGSGTAGNNSNNNSSTATTTSSSASSATTGSAPESAQTDYSAIAAQTVEKANTVGTKGNNYDSKVQEYADANELDTVLKNHQNVQIDTQIMYENGDDVSYSRYYDGNGCILTDSDGKTIIQTGDMFFTRSSDADSYQVLIDLWPDESTHQSDVTSMQYGFPQDSEMIFSDPKSENGQVEIQVTNQNTGLQGSLNFDESTKELQNYFYMVIDPKTQEMTVNSYNDDYQYDADTQEFPSELADAAKSTDTYTVTVVFDPSGDSATRTYTVPKGYSFTAAEGTSSDGSYRYELYTDSACTQKYTGGSDTDANVTLYAAKTALK